MTSRVLLSSLAFAALVLASVGCSSAPKEPPLDPLSAAKSDALSIEDRSASLDRVWAEAGGSPAAREALKSVAWMARAPSPVRVHALELILADPADPDGVDTRNMMRLMLPVEPDMGVIGFISRTAAERRWTDLAGPLVRSYSRNVAAPADVDRPERAALVALFPADTIERIVFRVFATAAGGEGRELERGEKARTAAWELLSRLDVDGSIRASLLDGETGGGDALLETLRAARRDLGAVPLTSSQLEWLQTLRNTADTRHGAERKAWWAQAAAAVASLRPQQRERLALRHAEPIRWASANRSEWMSLDRDQLATLMRTRLAGRPKAVRNMRDNGISDSFIDNEERLVWADVLTVLSIDDAIRQPGVVKPLFTQAEQDRADTSTEYGGIIRPDAARPDTFAAVLYPPRATQRTGDTRFVASDDLLEAGATALAHYHFHVQRVNNAEYAGPGPGDMDYALDQGRACVVFTSVRAGVLNANYYQPGLSVNLGEVAIVP
ncbi:MAG: hypothetical protein ACKVS8_12630 [Phycisphaerales bacterium]